MVLRLLFTELINNKLVGELHIFKSKIIIGQNGKPAILGKKFNELNLHLDNIKKFKDDKYYLYEVINV